MQDRDGRLVGQRHHPVALDIRRLLRSSFHPQLEQLEERFLPSGFRSISFPLQEFTSPSFAVVSDFNSDGNADIMTSGYSYAGNMLFGKGDGTFVETFFSLNTDALVVGDFNSDGKPDVASVTSGDPLAPGRNDPPPGLVILLGNGDGSFAYQFTQNFFLVGTPAVGDYNGDGNLDVAAQDFRERVLVYPGNGDGTFGAPRESGTGGSTGMLRAGDFNGDGRTDLVVADYRLGVRVLLAQGDGTFQAPLFSQTDLQPTDVTVGDLNHDGLVDLVVGHARPPETAPAGVNILLSHGDGTFAPFDRYAVGVTPQSVVLSDFNRDSYLDLAVSDAIVIGPGGIFPQNNVYILLGQGDGVFGPASPFITASTYQEALVSGDFNNDMNPDLTVLYDLMTTVLLGNSAPGLIAAGADAGDGSLVHVYRANDGALISSFYAFDPRFSGGVRVAVGDVNGDGFPDVICGAGPGAGPFVRVYDGRTLGPGLLPQVLPGPLGSFSAFVPDFPGGVFVAAGDGFDDVIVGADAGGAPEVQVFSGKDLAPLFVFMAYDEAFRGGVRVAAGDIDHNGKADIITGVGIGGFPNVSIYSDRSGVSGMFAVGSFLAFAPEYQGGVYVAAGDVNADGRVDVVVSAGLGGPEVAVFSCYGFASLWYLFPYDPRMTGGIRVAAMSFNAGYRADLVTAPGPGGGPDVKLFNATTQSAVDSFFVFSPLFTGGVFVAAGS